MAQENDGEGVKFIVIGVIGIASIRSFVFWCNKAYFRYCAE